MTLILLNLLLTLPQVFLYTYALNTTLRMKRPQSYTACSLLLSGALYLGTLLLPPSVQYVSGMGHIVIVLLLPFGFSKERKGTTFVCSAAYLTVSILADALLSVLYLSRYDHLREAVQTNVTVMVVLKLVYLLIMAALFYWLRYILCKRIRQLPQKLEWGLPLTLLPLNQAIILDILLYVVQTAPRAQWNFLLLGLAGGATVIVDLIFFTAWKKRQREQVLQEQLRLTERQMETQMRYYRKIRENMSLVNQIRHDLNNQLQTAYSLLQSDHADAARAQLDEIRANLGKKAGAEYCENPVVNAVLAEKAEICREQDISLDAKACVPPQIPVQSAHLCAILANLLDNAIAAAQKAEKPWIELNVSVRAGCLLFCCTNVCAGQKASKKAAEEELLPIHGVGMSILRRVAAFYQGDVQIHREDDRFHAIVMLPFSKKPELERGDFCAGRK